ncbi:hypothetical protein [Spirosoma linguale]|uniref:Uncharacterized protein n=1 Tax=Spirosoma linguale (strain ATCC 33905 / DSM 74 / LMG 10896 / Claus 1) TaxID=504472 RepID=D2QRK6_SPILD|nr:hypothetical protein Slin_4933 [Spirosoma linguale DSM 74]
MDIAIFLTGTIKPYNVPNLKRVDPLEREQDYYNSIKKWLLLGFPIVFVENSNYDSALIESLLSAHKECEYLKFEGKVSHLGKSHGEAEIVSFAFKNSKLIKECNTIIKSSGRQYIKNAVKILEDYQPRELYVISWLKRYLQYADSRFFIANKEFYLNYFLDELTFIDESKSIYFEHALARAIHKSMAEGKRWALPKEYPICEGISGTENFEYKRNIFSVIKGNLIIKLTNRLLKNDYL